MVHAPGRERRDYRAGGEEQALILRRDTDKAIIMWPQRKWYISISFGAAAALVGGFDRPGLQRRRDGAAVVAGERCTRWAVSGKGFAADMWIAADGIVMKAVGHLLIQGRQEEFATQLSGLRRGVADDAAFALPRDYVGLPIGVAGLGSGAAGAAHQ